MPYFVADGGSPENAAKLPIRSALAGNPVRQVGHTQNFSPDWIFRGSEPHPAFKINWPRISLVIVWSTVANAARNAFADVHL